MADYHPHGVFCGTELAARIEAVEAQMIASATEAIRRGGCAAFVMGLRGGVACFAQPGAPLNKVAGLGFGGAPGPDAMEAVERAYAERNSPVQVELSNLADPSVGALLTARGYRLVGFENVLGLALAARPPEPATPAAITVARCQPQERERWIDIAVEGFAAPDEQGRPSHESFSRKVIADAITALTGGPGFSLLLARDQGIPAGAASFRMADGVAQLTGAATLPAHRRRGVHTALLAARMAEAAAAGCDVAVVTTQPGSKSQENAIRNGFSLLYTRAILVKETAAA
jgi:GNAT superfamily N-acetyltransferase